MKLTLVKLKELNACSDAVEAFNAQKEQDAIKLCQLMIKENKLNWCNWLLSRLLPRKDKIRYAIFAAEQVIGLYEKKYPDDNRPRKAIEAAKLCLKNNSKKNKVAANAAAYAAADAAYAAANAADEMKIKILNYGIKLLK